MKRPRKVDPTRRLKRAWQIAKLEQPMLSLKRYARSCPEGQAWLERKRRKHA